MPYGFVYSPVAPARPGVGHPKRDRRKQAAARRRAKHARR